MSEGFLTNFSLISDMWTSPSCFTPISTNAPNTKYLYKSGEIFPRYIGIETIENVYNWPMDEYIAKYYYINNRKTYENLVLLYGEPYSQTKQFSVYDFTKENTPLVGSYNDVNTAKEKLKVQE